MALIGWPNSGKSSLLNRLVGEDVAIVTPLPQTTRQCITGIWNDDTSQIIFRDTPGIYDGKSKLNHEMTDWARKAARDADITCLVLAADKAEDVSELLEVIPSGRLAMVVLNRCDLVAPDKISAMMDSVTSWADGVPIFPVSAKTGCNLAELKVAIAGALPESPPLMPTDLYTDHSVRFLVAEQIRWAAMSRVYNEVPYSIAVKVEQFEDQPQIARIRAKLLVERDSQRGILIGRGGEMIRDIGRAARLVVEELVGKKVYLELTVVVGKNWPDDAAQLARLGLLSK